MWNRWIKEKNCKLWRHCAVRKRKMQKIKKRSITEAIRSRCTDVAGNNTLRPDIWIRRQTWKTSATTLSTNQGRIG